MLAVDDGLWQGNFDLADVCFLIALIIFALHFVLVVAKRPDILRGGLLGLGLAFLAAGLLVL